MAKSSKFPASAIGRRENFIHAGKALSLEAISHWHTLRRVLDCAFICNNAKLEKKDVEIRVIGDPTEGALVCLAEKAGLRGTHQRLHLNPFESIRKRMSVVVRPYRQKDAGHLRQRRSGGNARAVRPHPLGR